MGQFNKWNRTNCKEHSRVNWPPLNSYARYFTVGSYQVLYTYYSRTCARICVSIHPHINLSELIWKMWRVSVNSTSTIHMDLTHWPCDAIRRQTTLVRAMAPRHYFNRCCLQIIGIQPNVISQEMHQIYWQNYHSTLFFKDVHAFAK